MAKSIKPKQGQKFSKFVGKLENQGEPIGEAKAGSKKKDNNQMSAWSKKGKKRATK